MIDPPTTLAAIKDDIEVEKGVEVEGAADSRKIAGNVVSLGGSALLARGVAFVGTAYLARVLGPSGFGIIGFAIALFGYFALAVSTGFNAVGAREVARRPEQASAIAGSVILFRLLLACVAAVAMALVAWSLHKPPAVKMVVALTGLSFFSIALDTTWVYKGLEQGRRVGLATILAQVFFVAVVLVVVKKPEDVFKVPLAQFFGDMSAALFLAVPLLGWGRIKWKHLNLREGFHIFRSSGFKSASKLLRTLIYTFDVVLIGLILGEREVGLYSAPYRICFLLLAIAVAVHDSYLPALTRAAAQGAAEISDLVERSLSLACTIAAPLVVGGIVLAAPLLRLLFGPAYVEGAGAFRFLLLSIAFIFMHGAARNVLLVCNRMKKEMWITAAASAINVGANLLFIPHYGSLGAAFNTALAEGLILILSSLAILKMGIRCTPWPVLRPLPAALVMGVVLLLLGNERNMALYLVVGTVVYGAVLTVFGGIPQDATVLVGGMRRKFAAKTGVR